MDAAALTNPEQEFECRIPGFQRAEIDRPSTKAGSRTGGPDQTSGGGWVTQVWFINLGPIP